MWPQEETEERLGEAEFIILTGARHRRLSAPHRATGKDTRVVRRQEIGGRGREGPLPSPTESAVAPGCSGVPV